MAKKRHHKQPSQIRGLFCIVFSILLILSLLSFSQGKIQENWLGYIGYSLAWLLLYLFGLGSFLIVIFFLWMGFQMLSSVPIQKITKKLQWLVVVLISFCFLLTVFAEAYPTHMRFLENRIHSETILFYLPHPSKMIRYNTGGIPFYFLYQDFPFFPLKKIFGSSGTFLIFFFLLLLSICALNSSFFPFELKTFSKKAIVKIFKGIKTIVLLSYRGLKKLFVLLKEKRKKKLQVSLSTKRPFEKSTLSPSQPLKKPSPVKQKFSYRSLYSPPKVAKSFSFESKNKTKHSYFSPPPSLLSNPPDIDHPSLCKELKRQAEILEETLNSFGIEAKVGEIHCGPTIVSFEIHPAVGVKVQKIKALESDIALNLQAKSIRIIAPIPGKAAVGVEIPSLHPQPVSFKEMLLHYQQTSRKLSIPLLLGKTVTGDSLIADLTRMPHCLIAGATGSGKSVCINTLVMSILMNATPSEIRLLLIDPKKVELTQYTNLPHMIAPVITEPHGAYAALHWLVKEMHRRYDILKHLHLRNIFAFNNRRNKEQKHLPENIEIPENLPLIVAIIDEFADLMMVSSSDLETPIARIAQMARAVGIHLILSTQRPSREVITGIIKANFPCRIAFKVASRINSQIILDETGAESLLGNGDLLFSPPGSTQLVRAQGAYISDEDINRSVTYLCQKSPPNYLIPSFDNIQLETNVNKNYRDKLYDQALELVLLSKNASTTFLQRKLKIGYARAASLIDELEENGIIGPAEGSRPRRILASSRDFE